MDLFTQHGNQTKMFIQHPNNNQTNNHSSKFWAGKRHVQQGIHIHHHALKNSMRPENEIRYVNLINKP